MSCLKKKYRINSSREFNKIYENGKRWHNQSFVVFFSPSSHLKVAFVASKKVGKAVQRNKAKRRIRGLFLSFEEKVITGNYIFVAKQNIFTKSPKELEKNFIFSFKGLKVLK